MTALNGPTGRHDLHDDTKITKVFFVDAVVFVTVVKAVGAFVLDYKVNSGAS